MDPAPHYVCAILEDRQGRLLFEKRPVEARLAAGRLTCFGGRRESGETPEQCLRRELREELDWEPREFQDRVELWIAGELMAWFFGARLDVDIAQLRVHQGHEAVLVARQDFAKLPISGWHRAVLDAWLRGETSVMLDA